MGTGSEIKPFYYGPPRGIYQARNFDDFATIQIPRKLLEMRRTNTCVKKVDSDMIVTYNYPGAGIEITHEIKSEDRCEVKINAEERQTLEAIVDFIHSKEKE